MRLSSLIAVLFLLPIIGMSQHFELPKDKKNQKIKFQLESNVIVIPITVNGSELSFILDSGVSTPILFNLSDQDSIQINRVSEITVNGLGDGKPIKALRSTNNRFRLGAIQNDNQHLFVVLDRTKNFSLNLGIPVHGIIGYDLFADFVVEINYSRKTLHFYRPEQYDYKPRKNEEVLPLHIRNKKAYLDGVVYTKNNEGTPVKLLVDSGSSDAVWLFESDSIPVPHRFYEDYLGEGLNGFVYGKRTMIKGLQIGRFHIKNAKSAFPDMVHYAEIENIDDRNGSIGGQVLKRFNMVLDYSRGKIILKKNGNFNAPFKYNFSGIEVRHEGMRYISEKISNRSSNKESNEGESFGDVQLLFEDRTRLSLVPEIVVSAIRNDSPAMNAGLKTGDVILSVNGKKVYSYKLQEVVHMLNQEEGKRIKLRIARADTDMEISFYLKNLFKEKP